MIQYVSNGHISLTSLEVSPCNEESQWIAGAELMSFEAFCWSMTALAIALSGLRYWIRLWTPKKYMWDDLTHILALGTFIASVALYQTVFRDGYYIEGLQRKLTPLPSQEVYVDLYARFQHRAIAVTILSCTTLWLVKATFLLFYRQIFWIDEPFRKAWWAVTFFIIITYWATVAGVLVRCGSVENIFSIGKSLPGKL